MLITEHEASLYKELIAFPQLLLEVHTIREDVYSVMLATPLLSHQNNTCRPKKSSGGSKVERLVVSVLNSAYLRELEKLTTAAQMLYDESPSDDQRILLCLWRGEAVESFPPRLLYRYEHLKSEVALRQGEE